MEQNKNHIEALKKFLQEDKKKNYNQAFVRLFGTDGKEASYNGYKAQKADFLELALRGKEIIFPTITNGAITIEKAMVFDRNGVALAEMQFPERWVVNVGETPIINFGVIMTENGEDEEEISNEAVDLLRMISENSTFLSGTTHGIDEKSLDKVNKFLSRITD